MEKSQRQARQNEVLKSALDKLGVSSFRPLQKSIIKSVLRKKDVFALMPTGHGKSLCFQVPAILLPGIALVVSPLLALISDQIQILTKKGIKAASLNSSQSAADQRAIYADLASNTPSLKVLFITPERLCMKETWLVKLYERKLISFVTIDEAHCVVSWGSTFRKSYAQLGRVREWFPSIPILALTATATRTVQKEIMKCLKMSKEYKHFQLPMNRPNLKFIVRYKELLCATTKGKRPVLKDLCKWIQEAGKLEEKRNSVPQSSLGDLLKGNETSADESQHLSVLGGLKPEDCPCCIVYCHKRDDTEKVAQSLRSLGLSAEPFHGGMSKREKVSVQERWQSGDLAICVATIAFGMGIDKSNVRLVIHWKMPNSMSGYFQECGRAGRDGKPSLCVIYYSFEDFRSLKFLNSSTESNTRRAVEPNERSGKLDARMKTKDKSKPSVVEGDASRASEGLISQSKVNEICAVAKYCEMLCCRRQAMLKVFGEKYEPNANSRQTCCDYCDDPETAGLLNKQLINAKQISVTTKGNSSSRVKGTIRNALFGNSATHEKHQSQRSLRHASLVSSPVSLGLVDAGKTNSSFEDTAFNQKSRKRKAGESHSSYLDRLEALEERNSNPGHGSKSKRQMLMSKLGFL